MFKFLSGTGSKKAERKSEERKNERFDFFQTTYFRSENGAEKTYQCWSNNISMGGLCFDAESGDIGLDEKIKILYKIETKIRHDVCCIKFKSKALNNWRYGCQFADDDPQRDELIEKYINDHVLAKR